MRRASAHLHPAAIGLRCIRCAALFPFADYHMGCPACFGCRAPASLAVEYREFPKSLNRLADWQVYPDYPTLGEGNTPMVELPELAEEIGIRELRLKNEGSNPTGSHKDRMSRLIVQRAIEVGARTVAAASSGNAGVSLAAYAAYAGLDCVIVTTTDINPNWRRAIEMHGATLQAAATPGQRWEVTAARVKTGDWYPATNFITPPVGSNPYGVDGYRSLALEIFRDLGTDCSDILVPTSRADLLWGIARGYHDLRKAGFLEEMPRIHAVEPFQRISTVLAGRDYRESFAGDTALISIGGTTVTYQALDALSLCAGSAVVAEEKGARHDQVELARCGLYLEVSSAAALTGLRNLVQSGVITLNAKVILIGTSNGMSEHATFSQPVTPVQLEEP